MSDKQGRPLLIQKTEMPEASSDRLGTRLLPTVCLYSLIVIALLLASWVREGMPSVGRDNDDLMRLVQVHDFLAGQGWFDLHQYRLGLDGGTLMHWSRLVDLPIASLIRLFSLIASPERAELLAVITWPLLLTIPVIAMMALGGRWLGGPQHAPLTMHVSAGLTVLQILLWHKFQVGALDHHNVQLVVVATLSAMLIDPSGRRWSAALAGIAAALGVAIGAETTPFVAVACCAVALLWAYEGHTARTSTLAFSLGLIIALSLFFVATVPPSQFSAVTCDNLSLGYWSTFTAGSLGLLIASVFLSDRSFAIRFSGLIAVGIFVALVTVLIAPTCLQGPFANLDPLLETYWLDHVEETYTIIQNLRHTPEGIGSFYLVGLFALLVCIWRIRHNSKRDAHIVLGALILVNWLISLAAVRVVIYTELVSILPLALMITDLREKANRPPKSLRSGLIFALATLLSVPTIWAFAGTGVDMGVKKLLGSGTTQMTDASDALSCADAKTIQSLAKLGTPETTVAAPIDLGSRLLLYTPMRVLAAPYHRDQEGMAAEIRIGLASPKKARTLLQQANVGLIAFCPKAGDIDIIIRNSPSGLYADLKRGQVPDYLIPLPTPQGSGLQIFRTSFKPAF